MTREQDTKQFSEYLRLQYSEEHKNYKLDPTDDREGVQTHPVESTVDRKPTFSILPIRRYKNKPRNEGLLCPSCCNPGCIFLYKPLL